MFGQRHHADVAIAGAGPVGMCAGLLVDSVGVKPVLFDKDPGPALHSYSPALQPSTLEVLAELGLADEILSKALKISRVEFFEGSGKCAEVNLGALESDYPCLALTGQNGFESILMDALKKRRIPVNWHHRLRDLEIGEDGVTAFVDQMELGMTGYAFARTELMVSRSLKWQSGHVIGADGHDSIVRKRLELPFESLAPRELFAVFEFESDCDLDPAMRVVLGDDGASVLWPLGGGRWRWSFQMSELETGEYSLDKDPKLIQVGDGGYPELDEGMLADLLARRAPWFEASVDRIRWRIAVGFDRRLANRFGSGRVWLAGDAAHLAGPVALQSMNAGISEVRDLVHILAGPENVDRGAALEAFNRERLAEWKRRLLGEWDYECEDSASEWVRKRAASILSSLPVSTGHLGQAAAQLGIRLKE